MIDRVSSLFKQGDKLLCVKNNLFEGVLTLGKIYVAKSDVMTVSHVEMITVDGDNGVPAICGVSRFEKEE